MKEICWGENNELKYIIESGEAWAHLCLSNTDSDSMTNEEKEWAKRCSQKSYIASKLMMQQIAGGITSLSVKQLEEKLNKFQE